MSAGKLPEGWVETQLGKIIELKYGKSLAAPSRDGKDFPVYGSNGIVGMHSAPLINGAGLIVGRKGSYGVVQKSTGPFFPIDTTYYIDDFYNQPIDYWYYYLTFLPLTKLNRSTAIPGLNREDAYNLNIAIPSLSEQKIIAEKLDTLLAQVDSTKARLEQIPQILKRFRQAVLGAAVSGNLTEAWRRKNNFNFDNWENLTLGHIVKKIEAGKNLKCIEIPPDNHQYGIIKISAVTWGEYDEEESKTLPDNSLFIESRRISVGDFLISRANTLELLGNPVIVKQVTKNLMLSDKVLRLVMEDYDKPWINIFLRSFYGRREIEFRSTGNQLSMRNIGQKALLEIPIPKPSTEEQHEIVRRVEQLFAYADTIEKQVNSALTRVNSLTQSILAKAFRGELTAQWRAENPSLISGENSAAALLEKIKAERAASGGKKAARKKA